MRLVKIFCFCLIGSAAFGQAWTGILNTSRAVDWSNAGTNIINRSTICSTLTSSATFSQINTAIAGCSNGVVLLGSGTYSLTGGISFLGHSNVTLRGAGPGSTILQFSAGVSCGGQGADICVSDSSPFYVGSAQVQPGGSNACSWTSGYAQGTTSITVSSCGSTPSVGQVIILDQANDTIDTGGVYICDTAACHQGGETASSNGRTIGGVDYDQTQVVTITGISGSTWTISPGLYANNWRTGKTPGVWWTHRISGVGLENLTIDNTSSGSSVLSGMFIYDCDNCWIQNVISIKGNRNHVWDYQSSHLTIRSSYFYGTQATAQESYGVESLISSDALIENDIFQQIASPIMSTGASGRVVAYDFTINNLYQPGSTPTWTQNSYMSHDAGNEFNLYEGNQFNSLECDSVHGTGAPGNTIFRNWLPGRGFNNTTLTSNNTYAVNTFAFCRGYNIVGSVLGTASYFTNYQITPSIGSPSNCNFGVYIIGFGTVNCGSGTPGNDSLTASTLLRWGNYDNVNAAVQWNSSEIPTTGVAFINGNPVPASHVLPNSFYLAGQPVWWGTMPWPAVGPDVTGGSGPAGLAYNNPAANCYFNVLSGPTNGTGSVLAFDATTCYAAIPSGNPIPRQSNGIF